MILAGNILIFAGIGFMLFSVICLFILSSFYAKILVVAKIDILGSLTFIIGVALKHGFGFFSLKLLLLAFLLLLINPLITHMIAHAVHMSENKDITENSGDKS